GATATQADIVDMGNASFLPAIIASGQLTFSAWIKTTDTTGNRNTVVFAGDDTSSNVYSDLGVAAGQTGFLGAATARNRPAAAPVGQQSGIYSSPAVPPVNDGNWHHLAMTVNQSTSLLTLWVDGVVANTQFMSLAAFPAFNNFEIGRLGRSSPTDPFSGQIDDVQVYDQALAPYQIAYLKNHPGQEYIPADTDGDGLDDAWEIFYFGNITAQDGSGDPNGDGIPNSQEQTQGTNPGVLPAIKSAAFIAGGDYVINFTGNPNTTYQVKKSTTLAGFEALTPVLTGTTDGDGNGSVTVPAAQAAGPAGFYRLEIP
ncbi:MAG: hypothetical protein JWO82_2625, partial [Akkermansiaceae bacterium]|nr:hypothetical protein [Akkermansiaceae bacterium]